MMGLGFPELMIILVIIMIIFGAGKLPEIGSAFGRSIKNFKTSMKDAEQEELPAGDQTEAEGSIEGAEEPKAVPESTGETAEVSESQESAKK
jgi:sec-independent protein translocase protein TatA